MRVGESGGNGGTAEVDDARVVSMSAQVIAAAGGDDTALADENSIMTHSSMGEGVNAVGQDEESVLAFDCSSIHC